jgi:hypothetical protein
MYETVENDDDDLAEDRLVGAEAIAAYRGESVRRTRYLLSLGLIPHGREGRQIVGSKRAIRRAWHRVASASEEHAAE